MDRAVFQKSVFKEQKLLQVLIFFTLLPCLKQNETLSVTMWQQQQQQHYIFPTEWRTVCDTAFTSWQNNLHSVSAQSPGLKSPEGIRMIDASFCWLLSSFFLSPPNNSEAWMQTRHENTTHWNHSDSELTSWLRFSVSGKWLRTTISQLCRQLWRLCFD